MKNVNNLIIGIITVVTTTILLVFLSCSANGDDFVDIQPSDIDDAFIHHGYSDNQGDNSALKIQDEGGSARYSFFIRFSDEDLDGIPESTTIKHAQLELYCFSADDAYDLTELDLYRVIEDWDEDTISGSNSPDASSYLYGQAQVRDDSDDTWVKFNKNSRLDNLIEDWLDGSKDNYGLYIKWDSDYDGNVDALFYSSDNSDDGRNPNLYVWFNYWPDIPDRPSGPSDGDEGEEYDFYFTTTDQDDDDVRYEIDWGDGTEVTSYYNSGDTATRSHTWNSGGEFHVKVRASDADQQGWTEWSNYKIINIEANDPPTAILESDTTEIEEGESVFFDGRDSDDDEAVDQYFFDYGDGESSGWTSQSTMSHSYESQGEFNAKLKVKDNRGKESEWSNTVTIYVTGPNNLPVSVLESSTTAITEGESITFDGSDSYDDDGTVDNYFFDFGDGANSGWITQDQISHQYDDEGNYSVKLKVKDNDDDESNWSNSVTINVSRNNQAPTAKLNCDSMYIEEGDAVEFDGTESSDDESVSEYWFEYGDGDNSGWITQSIRTHIYNFEGTYDAKLKVKDHDGIESNWSSIITIEVDKPNAQPQAILETNKNHIEPGELVNFDGSSSTDKDGTIEYYFYDFGDGETTGWVTQASNSHSYAEHGQYDAKLMVKDNKGKESNWSEFETIEVVKSNQPPTAVLDSDINDIDEGDSILFDASGSFDDESIKEYYYDYGDTYLSNWVTHSTITHTYNAHGTYFARLKVKDNEDAISEWSDIITITVNAINMPPTSILHTDKTNILQGESILFTASDSNDTDGIINYYYYEFGDGTNSGWIEYSSISHVYTMTGNYASYCKVKDNNNGESNWSNMIMITVETGAIIEFPIAHLEIAVDKRVVGEEIIFNGIKSSGNISHYYFDFGDNTVEDWTTEHTIKHTYNEPGTYIVFLKVKNSYGESTPVTTTLMIVEKSNEDDDSPSSSIAVMLMIFITSSILTMHLKKSRRD